MSAFFEKVKDKLLNNKKLCYILVAVLIIVILLVYFSSFFGGDKSNKNTSETVDREEYSQTVTRQLEETLTKIKGAGKVKAMLNFESTPEIIVAYITSISGDNQTTTPQIIAQQGSQLPLILKTVYPKPTGAIIVAEGAGDTKVLLRLQDAAVTVLGIPTSLVNVFPMKK